MCVCACTGGEHVCVSECVGRGETHICEELCGGLDRTRWWFGPESGAAAE